MNKVRNMAVALIGAGLLVFAAPSAKAEANCISNIVVNFGLAFQCPSNGVVWPVVDAYPYPSHEPANPSANVWTGPGAIYGTCDLTPAVCIHYHYDSPPGGNPPLRCCYSYNRIIGVISWTRICGTNVYYNQKVIRIPAGAYACDVVVGTCIIDYGGGCSCSEPVFSVINPQNCGGGGGFMMAQAASAASIDSSNGGDIIWYDWMFGDPIIVSEERPLTIEETIQQVEAALWEKQNK